MTIQYKNQGFTLANTAATSVLTAPSDARLLIKQIQAVNIHSSAVTLTTQLTDTSASATHTFGNQDIAAVSTVDIITNTLVLEEGDILKMTAETGAKISGVISYAQLDRSQENG
jgi:hypothetical protein|tara:strand:- start:1470 stop:1811 length:342 start_codon:yes stop_codon:yes gene_type:complete